MSDFTVFLAHSRQVIQLFLADHVTMVLCNHAADRLRTHSDCLKIVHEEAEFAPLALLGCRALGVSCQDLWGAVHTPGHLAGKTTSGKHTSSIPLISYFKGGG